MLTGGQVSLSALLTHGPVAVVFYRGEWCPYCNLTLRAYQGIQSQIAELGATMVAISPQTPDNSLTTMEKKGLTFPVLSDLGNAVGRQYGLVFAYSEQVRPLLSSFGSALPAFNGDDSWEVPFAGVFVVAQDHTIASRVRRPRLDQATGTGDDPGEPTHVGRTLTPYRRTVCTFPSRRPAGNGSCGGCLGATYFVTVPPSSD